ncbi:MAG TPA: metalloprotease family protein [Candidatus Diapherotrites archaeon]|nr:metalloprotease family protein [Candidatus Diapherotrites archaeon]
MELNEIMHILFFPGIILHETAHALACLIFGVKIKKIKFIDKSGGYVVHEDSKDYKIIIISLFPFLFNIFIAIICASIIEFTKEPFYIFLLVWIGISALFFCVPSDQDTNNSFEAIKRTYYKKQSFWLLLLKVLFLPFFLLLTIILALFKIFDKVIAVRLLLVGFWIYLLVI